MDDTSLQGFIDGWELFADATLTGTIAGSILGFLGVYVVLRRMVFLTAALSQVASLGVVVAFYAHGPLGIPAALAPPTLVAVALTSLVLLPVAFQRPDRRARSDSHLGLAYLLGAAGTLVLGTRVVEELHDIDTILLGTAL